MAPGSSALQRRVSSWMGERCDVNRHRVHRVLAPVLDEVLAVAVDDRIRELYKLDAAPQLGYAHVFHLVPRRQPVVVLAGLAADGQRVVHVQ